MRAEAEVEAGRRAEVAPARVLVIIPAYNEGPTIAGVLAGIPEKQNLSVAVIDDGSSDDTAERARAAGARVIRHPFNMGYGVALQTGYKYAASRGFDLVVQLDGDGQHDPSFIAPLIEPILSGEADVAIGSRFLIGDGYIPTFSRRVGMVLFGFLASWVIGRRITDPTSGFQALSKAAYRYFTEDHFPFDYPDADVLILLHRARFRLREVPVAMRPDASGRSMHSGLAPVYYVFKMLLSIAMTLLREAPGRLDAAAPEDHGPADRPGHPGADPGAGA